MRADRKRLLRVIKTLRLAILVIENDARCDEHHFPEHAKTRLRWAKELSAEAGITSSQP